MARLATLAALTTGVLVGAGTPAEADIPPGWVPGVGSFEAHYGGATWKHEGFYAGVAGNWHTGRLEIDEPGEPALFARLIDWKCPMGVEPPSPSAWDPPTACKVKRYQLVDFGEFWDVATFNHKRDRLVLRGDFPATGLQGEPAGTVHFDLYLEGVGEPRIESYILDGTLDYGEHWSQVLLRGTIDGHGLGGHGTTQLSGDADFHIAGYVPA